MNDEKLQIDIWSDVACPWCYVGKRRFEAALAAFEHRDQVEVTWHSFELDPAAAPARETDSATHLAAKYGMTREQAQAKLRQMTDLAAGDGLAFDFERARGANMFDAHRLVHLAAAHGRQDAMKERLFRAYLGEGELVSDHATLARLADDVGLPAAEVRDVLATDRYAAEVREDEGTALPRSASPPCRSSSPTARWAWRARSRPRCSASCCGVPGRAARRWPWWPTAPRAARTAASSAAAPRLVVAPPVALGRPRAEVLGAASRRSAAKRSRSAMLSGVSS